MNMNTLLVAIRNAIADDTTTKAWTQTNYTKDHKVYVGTDRRQEPAESAYPLVAIFPAGKEAGYDAEVYSHDIDIVCGINDGNTRTVAGKANIVEMTGIENIESFRKLVENAITGASLGGTITMLSIIYEPIEFFPYFLAGMTVRVVSYAAQGDDPFQ